jgi:hypothetical protein
MAKTKASEEADVARTKVARAAQDRLWPVCVCGMARRLQRDADGVLRWANHRRYIPLGASHEPGQVPGVMVACAGSGSEPVATWPAFLGEGES